MWPIIIHILFAILFFTIFINPFGVVTKIYLKAYELGLKFLWWRANR